MNTDIQLDANLRPVSETGHPHVFTHETSANLLWLFKDADPDEVSANKAAQVVKKLRAGGFDDWRQPDDIELSRRIDRSRYNPAADPALDDVKSTWYWTSRQAAWSASVRWCVDFFNGHVCYHRIVNSARVRAVRSWSGPSPVGQ